MILSKFFSSKWNGFARFSLRTLYIDEFFRLNFFGELFSSNCNSFGLISLKTLKIDEFFKTYFLREFSRQIETVSDCSAYERFNLTNFFKTDFSSEFSRQIETLLNCLVSLQIDEEFFRLNFFGENNATENRKRCQFCGFCEHFTIFLKN